MQENNICDKLCTNITNRQLISCYTCSNGTPIMLHTISVMNRLLNDFVTSLTHIIQLNPLIWVDLIQPCNMCHRGRGRHKSITLLYLCQTGHVHPINYCQYPFLFALCARVIVPFVWGSTPNLDISWTCNLYTVCTNTFSIFRTRVQWIWINAIRERFVI